MALADRGWRRLAALACCLAATAASAQSVEAPRVEQREVWLFKVHETGKPDEVLRYVDWIVKDAGPQGWTTAINGRNFSYNAQGATVSNDDQRNGLISYVPPQERLAFPMVVGKTRLQEGRVNYADGSPSFAYRLQSMPTGWEMVDTPAGALRAIRIEQKEWLLRVDAPKGTLPTLVGSRVTHYVPELKVPARQVAEPIGTQRSVTVELIDAVVRRPAAVTPPATRELAPELQDRLLQLIEVSEMLGLVAQIVEARLAPIDAERARHVRGCVTDPAFVGQYRTLAAGRLAAMSLPAFDAATNDVLIRYFGSPAARQLFSAGLQAAFKAGAGSKPMSQADFQAVGEAAMAALSPLEQRRSVAYAESFASESINLLIERAMTIWTLSPEDQAQLLSTSDGIESCRRVRPPKVP